jgi:ubiquinone biosynthesis accessory factor UbiK
MSNRNVLDELAEVFSRVLPQAQAAGEEARDTAKAGLRQVLSKMDLVTREEFEAQERALSRAEAKIAELEVALTELQQRLAE